MTIKFKGNIRLEELQKPGYAKYYEVQKRHWLFFWRWTPLMLDGKDWERDYRRANRIFHDLIDEKGSPKKL